MRPTILRVSTPDHSQLAQCCQEDSQFAQRRLPPSASRARSERGFSIHQHFLHAEFLEYALLGDLADSGMNKFNSEFLIRRELLRTLKGELKCIFFETVVDQTQLLCVGVQIHRCTEFGHALARPIVPQQALIVLDVGVKTDGNDDAVR